MFSILGTVDSAGWSKSGGGAGLNAYSCGDRGRELILSHELGELAHSQGPLVGVVIGGDLIPLFQSLCL